MMCNPRPLAVADKFVFDANNGGGRRRKTRHITRKFIDQDDNIGITSFHDKLHDLGGDNKCDQMMPFEMAEEVKESNSAKKR